jgi:hypothetical protein
MDPVDEIFDAFGGPTAIAAATGIAVQTVCDWRAKGRKNIPTWRRPAVLGAVGARGLAMSGKALAYLACTEAA